MKKKSPLCKVQALSAGADDWIQKPIHKQRMPARIKRLLNKRPA